MNAYAGAVSLVVLARWRCSGSAGLPAARPLRARAGVAQRRGRRSIQDRGEAGQRQRAQGRRSGHHGGLLGFAADQPVLMVRKTADGPFERVPLIREDTKFQGMLFDLAGSLDYFVEAGGVRSTTFRLNVVDMPYVQKLELDTHFPAYTAWSPERSKTARDIAVLRGTEIRVKIVPTMPTKGGQIAINEQQPAGLIPGADGTLAGKFVADKDGFYRVELDAPTGERVTASPQYTIDVLTDQPPTVSIAKPGRDSSASPIEEVFIEARAEDDFGIKDLELVYSVNGAAEKSVRLFDGAKRLPEVSAGHTFYLEELDVSPGDFVSYYAARPTTTRFRAGRRPRATSTSCRSVRSRRTSGVPNRKPEAAVAAAGDNQVGALSQQQRQIISATFNINRDRKTMTAEKLKESSVVVALSQSSCASRSRAAHPHEQPPGRAGSAFKKIAELLPQAVTAMSAAEGKLRAPDPRGARARAEGAADPAEGRGGIRSPDQHAARRRGRRWWRAECRRRSSPICSRWSWTRSPTSARRHSAPSSRTPIRRWTS